VAKLPGSEMILRVEESHGCTALPSTRLDIGRGGNNFYSKGKYNLLSDVVVAIVVEMIGLGWGWGINTISQSILVCPTESSNKEMRVKNAIFGGGATLKVQWGDAWPQNRAFHNTSLRCA